MTDLPHTEVVSSQWVLLHGTPLDPLVWREVSARLSSYGDVFCPPVTPHGTARSSWALAGEVLAQTDRQLEVVGHSFGGQIGLDMALQAPQRVRSLTMICSRDTPFPAFTDAAHRLRHEPSADVEVSLTRWFTPAAIAADTPLVSYARQCLRDADPHAWADALDSIAIYDRSADVLDLRTPVRLVAAEHDAVSPPAAMAAMADRIDGAQFWLLSDATHMSVFEQLDPLVDIIRGVSTEPACHPSGPAGTGPTKMTRSVEGCARSAPRRLDGG